MKILYVCDTAYQLLNVCNIEYHRTKNDDDIVDLCVVNQFTNAELLINRIKETDVFSNVFTLKRPKELPVRVLTWSWQLFKFFVPSVAIRTVQEKRNRGYRFEGYNEIYACYFIEFVAAVLDKNRKARFYLVEDGTGTYHGNIILDSLGNHYERISNMFHKGVYLAKPKALWLNNPPLCQSTINAIRHKIPEVDQRFIKWANKVFGVSGKYSEKRVIWLLNATTDYSTMKNSVNRGIQILEDFHYEMIIRPHPREINVWNEAGYEIDRTNEIWELKIPQIDIENKMIIGLFSTGQLTPKFMYDKEPWLVFIHRVYSDVFPEKMNKEIDDTVNNLTAVYRNKERIIVPKNEEELRRAISTFLKDR